MPQYRVTKPCYFQNVYREPGKHDTVSVKQAFKELPSYLEEIEVTGPKKGGPKKGGKADEVDGLDELDADE